MSLLDRFLGRRKATSSVCIPPTDVNIPDPRQDEIIQQAENDAYDRLCRLRELHNESQLEYFERERELLRKKRHDTTNKH